MGSISEGGDEYSYKSFIKKARSYFLEKKDKAMKAEDIGAPNGTKR